MAGKPIFDPIQAGRPLRVAAFMSGSGTNVIKLLEAPDASYEVAFIFSDTATDKCRGQEIARRFDLPYFAYDVRRYHEKRGLKRSVRSAQGLAARREYDQVAARLVKAFGIDVIALGGYMSFLTLTGAINVHPADLSLTDAAGKRRFVGDDAVMDAIVAGRTELRSSTLFTDLGVDSGPLLMVSDPIVVELPAPLEELKADPARLRQVADANQERLKQGGDWVVFPTTLELIAQGRLGLTDGGVATLDGRLKPGGVRPAERS
ncbi:MAG: formyl transferase [Proteobacteria bacterium]|nr:formyl transferase [Pseudomonadota bacterium]MBU4382443.1 formyl transferase [Pseudomonadota bacterium]MBU4606504.1 formyl transferase [Pseudomonadota bacterium]MCG2764011.1 formyl transferase [Desulfarculaceae bacterium]